MKAYDIPSQRKRTERPEMDPNTGENFESPEKTS